MDSKTIIELSTLISGIIVSIVGAVSSIKQRRAQETLITTGAGTARISGSTTAGMVELDARDYDQLQARLAAAEAALKARDGGQTPAG